MTDDTTDETTDIAPETEAPAPETAAQIHAAQAHAAKSPQRDLTKKGAQALSPQSPSTTNTAQKQVAPEFGTWPANDTQVKIMWEVRHQFDRLLDTIGLVTPPANARYLSIVKTKLEEACMFAIKGITKGS